MMIITEAIEVYDKNDCTEPDPADYGVWVPGIPVLVENGTQCDKLFRLALGSYSRRYRSRRRRGFGLRSADARICSSSSLSSRLADIWRESHSYSTVSSESSVFPGKSFIPMLIGTGCGVPGIMASRTIENDRDRKYDNYDNHIYPLRRKSPVYRNDCGR